MNKTHIKHMKKRREEETNFSKVFPNNQIITACRIELQVQEMTMKEKLTMIGLTFITGKAAGCLIAFPFEFQFARLLNWFDHLVGVAEYQFSISFPYLFFLTALLYLLVFLSHGVAASFSHASTPFYLTIFYFLLSEA